MNKLCRVLCNSVLLCAILIDTTNACRGGSLLRKYSILAIASRRLHRKEGTDSWHLILTPGVSVNWMKQRSSGGGDSAAKRRLNKNIQRGAFKVISSHHEVNESDILNRLPRAIISAKASQ